MKPFLLIQSRPEDETSDDEYQAFLKYCELDESQLKRWRIESNSLPDISLKEWSGILVGGGPFNSSDQEHMKSSIQKRVEKEMNQLLDRVIEKDFPFLGACYGVGLIGTHQGGVISDIYSEPVAPLEITLEADDPLFAGITKTFVAFAGHKEACEVLPPSAVLLASSKSCPVHMFKVKQHVYATQFHPELDSNGLETRIRIYKHHGYFKPEEMDTLIAAGHSVTVTEPMKILKNFVRRYHRSD
jgi:GMP synthase (glutamine-hydrolysing)